MATDREGNSVSRSVGAKVDFLAGSSAPTLPKALRPLRRMRAGKPGAASSGTARGRKPSPRLWVQSQGSRGLAGRRAGLQSAAFDQRRIPIRPSGAIRKREGGPAQPSRPFVSVCPYRFGCSRRPRWASPFRSVCTQRLPVRPGDIRPQNPFTFGALRKSIVPTHHPSRTATSM